MTLNDNITNIFLCDLETRILDTCNPDFKAIFYRRYLDDTFVIFKEEHQLTKKGQLPFLHMSISRLNNKLSSSIFRKKKLLQV